MDMVGERRIAAPRERVWAALNDPDILRRCIPGCQGIERLSETDMKAVAVLKVGPVSARFQGAVTLSDLDPPNGYRITGEGQGGVAGFAKGSALVRLEEAGDATLLRYEVSAQIGGKLAQLGGRLIDATARKMTDSFFSRFVDEIAAADAPAPPVPLAASEAAAAAPADRDGRAGEAGRVGSIPVASADRGPGWWNVATLVLVAMALAWNTFAGVRPSTPGALSAEFTTAVQMLLVLAVGYLFGRGAADARR